MTSDLYLLPFPRRLERRAGTFTPLAGRLILLDSPQPQTLRFTAARSQTALQARYGCRWELTASPITPPGELGLTLRLDPAGIPWAQGYRLEIAPTGILLAAHDEAGLFYGVATLCQLLSEPDGLPCLLIEDWPDFPVRGVMLDISRDKVPQMETLLAFVDRLAGWKINQLQLYTEHTFAYRLHPDVWHAASPMTGEEILTLDAYCRERHMELVPNQNSFGHLERWLKHPRYAPLAEIHGEFPVPWGTAHGPFSLAPVHPGSLELVHSLYDELLPHFTSRQFNVGCDETFDLGHGQSQALCAARGVGRVYLDFLLALYRDVTARGFTLQFWGDIILHHPELVAELPPDAIALEWGYEADHPFEAHGAQFAAAGIPFYVCPGTSAWCSLAGRTDNALGNLRQAAEHGFQHGATGYLNTDWGDRGHWQALPVSYLGFAAGAAYSWCLETHREADWPLLLSRYAFDDPSGATGRVAYDLGNVYQATGVEISNGTLLFWILQRSREQLLARPGMTPAGLQRALAALDAALAPLGQERMARPDAALIRREFRLTARLLRYACHRGLWALGEPPGLDLTAELHAILAEYRALWLARNRPGGLNDSAARLESLLGEYQ